MSEDIADALTIATDAAAATFNGRGSVVKERELEMALETALWALGHEPQCQVRVHLREAWFGRVGGVDLAVHRTDGLSLIELKWDPKTLAACAWDSVKLAAALQFGEGSRAFLIAGSPVVDGLRSDDLIDDAEVRPQELRRRYGNEFDSGTRCQEPSRPRPCGLANRGDPRRATPVQGRAVADPHCGALPHEQRPCAVRVAGDQASPARQDVGQGRPARCDLPVRHRVRATRTGHGRYQGLPISRSER